MIPICALFMYPFFFLVANTLKSTQEVGVNPFGFPKEIITDTYFRVFQTVPLVRSFLNTVTITGVSGLLIVLFGAMAAYPVVYNKNKFNTILMFYLISGFLIPFQAVLIPLFEVMKTLKLINHIYGIIIYYTAGSAFAFFLILGYLKGLPKELSEAAVIDGCGVFRVFFNIILPLLKPILITTLIYQSMNIWNDFLAPNLFLNARSKSTLVLEVFYAKGQFVVDWPMFMSMSVIVLFPMIVFYIAMQKHIMNGLVDGAAKG